MQHGHCRCRLSFHSAVGSCLSLKCWTPFWASPWQFKVGQAGSVRRDLHSLIFLCCWTLTTQKSPCSLYSSLHISLFSSSTPYPLLGAYASALLNRTRVFPPQVYLRVSLGSIYLFSSLLYLNMRIPPLASMFPSFFLV